MRVLLVNANRYRRPAVPPLGLEYLVAPLRRSGHQPHLLDVCFAAEPRAALTRSLDETRPDVVGFTVRNVDTVLYHTNEFFLDEIAGLVEVVRASGPRVIVGGQGVATMPDEVRRYLGADHAVDGPGEGALPALLDALAQDASEAPPIVSGWAVEPDPAERHRPGELLDYAPYLNDGARFGFETQKGCTGRCVFCTEARRTVLARQPAVVADEIARLAELGATQLFCCDSEFNQSLAHCKAFLDELIARALPIDWTLYMKPLPHDAELFELLARSGSSSLTLSADTLSLYGAEPAYGEPDVTSFLDEAARAGLKVAVDLTVGLPREPADAPRRAIELFRRRRPSTVGVNAYLRLYPTAAMTALVTADADLRKHVEPPDHVGFVRPVHYHHLDDAALERLIAGDPLFRIEGREPGVNYERV
jgi:radical SAM superfamily enzyme YgiQ (UPF0313 family)